MRRRTLYLYFPALFRDVVSPRIPACILREREMIRYQGEHEVRRSILVLIMYCTVYLWCTRVQSLRPQASGLKDLKSHYCNNIAETSLASFTRSCALTLTMSPRPVAQLLRITITHQIINVFENNVMSTENGDSCQCVPCQCD